MHDLAQLPAVSQLIDLAIEEDLGRGDITTASVVGARAAEARARLVARTPITVFGLEIAAEVFRRVDSRSTLEARTQSGDPIEAGATLASLQGPADSLLAAERTALNFLQRLSGVATLSRRYADAVAHTTAKVVDTRKTTPGYRILEKSAVAAGGCLNHRFDLGGGVLIKDNHIAACGSVADAIANARARAPHGLKIEIEVDSIEQLDQALGAHADIVLLDNMTPTQIRACRELADKRAPGVLLEASGGITLDTIASYAEAGVDYISIGALTHSAPAVDIGLDWGLKDS